MADLHGDDPIDQLNSWNLTCDQAKLMGNTVCPSLDSIALWSALDHRQDTHITVTTVYSGQQYPFAAICYKIVHENKK